MSCKPTWTVWCDAEADGCEYWCVSTEDRAAAARDDAREAGWHRTRDRRDICPNCWKKGNR